MELAPFPSKSHLALNENPALAGSSHLSSEAPSGAKGDGRASGTFTLSFHSSWEPSGSQPPQRGNFRFPDPLPVQVPLSPKRKSRSRGIFSWSGQWDLNPRPPAPKAGALANCAMARGYKDVTRKIVAKLYAIFTNLSRYHSHHPN